MKRQLSRLLLVVFFASMIIPMTILAPTALAQTYAGDISVTGDLTIVVPAGLADDYLEYYIDGVTPGNNLTMTVSGIDTGGGESLDVDLYDLGSDYCGTTDNNTCTINSVTSFTYYLDVYELNSVAYGSFTIYLEETAGSPPVLANGSEEVYNAGNPGTLKEYTIDIPAGKSDFQTTTRIAFGAPDVDLYVNEGTNVSADHTDTCYSENVGVAENCTIASPATDTYYIGLEEQTGTSGWLYVRSMYTEKTLSDGVDETNLSFTADEWKFYQIVVPSGQISLDIETSGGTGNVNMYVSLGEYPLDDGSADASSEGATNAESISISNPTAGTYYIALLEGDSSTASGITLNADYSAPTDILNGEIVSNSAAVTGEYDYYKVTIPSGASTLYIATSGGTGTSADLYHKYGSVPTTGSSDNSSTSAGTNTESITIASPTVGDHYIGVYANGGNFSGVQLTAEFVNGTLSKGVNQSVTSLSQNEWEHYGITLPSGSTDLTVTTTGGTGDVSVYAKYNDFARVSSNDGSSETASSNEESFVITSPSTGGWRVGVKGESVAATSTTLNVDYTSASSTTMTNGQTITGLSGSSGAWDHYRVTLPANALNLQVTSSSGTGNANLYLRYADFPDTSNYDCLSSEADNDEQCIIEFTSAGDYYFSLYGAAAYSGVSLKVSWDVEGELGGTPGDWEVGAQVTDPDTQGHNSGWGYDLDIYRGATDDYMIIASDNHSDVSSGAAWVYKRNGSAWDLQEGNSSCASFTSPGNDCLLPTNAVSNTKVAIDNVNAMVGHNNTDGVYAFTLDTINGDWEREAGSVKSSDFDGTDSFGYDIDIDGDYAIIGAPQEDENGAASGSAYIFNWNGSTWVQQDKLIRDDCAVGGSGVQDCASDEFGYSVAISGEYAIVGARYHKYNEVGTLVGGGGATYVYKRTGSSWALEDKQLSSNHGNNDQFGYSVALDGTTAVVGAIYGDHPLDSDVGASYVFEQNGTSWDQQDQLEQDGFSPTPNRDLFGKSVSVYGDYALVGAPDHNNQSNGKLYLFENSAGTWTQISSYVGDFNLGWSVAMDGNDFYGGGGSPQGGGPIILENTGGGSGGAVPEFSDYVYIITIAIAVFLMFKVIPKITTLPRRI